MLFRSGFLNASDFVVNVIKDAASLVGALDQVTGFVVGVPTVEHNTTRPSESCVSDDLHADQ